MAARKEPPGWVQGIASPRSLFLRRKVANPHANEGQIYSAFAVQLSVVGPINHTHAAAANFLNDAIVA